jgi:hypothetical protein
LEKLIINPLSEKMEPIAKVLSDLAAQENCDGEPYDQMQDASEYIKKLEKILEEIKKSSAGKIVLNEIRVRLGL